VKTACFAVILGQVQRFIKAKILKLALFFVRHKLGNTVAIKFLVVA